MRYLILSPHPDDAELAMGGTIARLVGQGHHLVLCDLTNGEPTPHGSIETRQRETAAANVELGNPVRVNLGLPNRWLEADPASRVKVAEAIREHRPDVMFVPYPRDAHPDHLAANLLGQQARFVAKYTKTDMAGQPHWTPRLIYFFCTHLHISIQPSFVLDISAQIDAKMRAIDCYTSQFYTGRGEAAGAVPEQVRTTARYFGQRIGVQYAEPFYVEEVLGLSTLDAVL